MAGAKLIADVLCDTVHKAFAAAFKTCKDTRIPLLDKMPATIPSLRSITKFALGSAQVALLPPVNNAVFGGSPPSCPNAQLSCHNTTVQTNLCCFNAPGGQLLQTQFWDSNPATGPADSWTIHGLVRSSSEPFSSVMSLESVSILISTYISNVVSYFSAHRIFRSLVFCG